MSAAETEATAAEPPIRVLIVDDTSVVRDMLRLSLDLDPDFVVVGEAADGEQAITALANLDPDVVVLDWQMPVLDGPGALPALRRLRPHAGIVMFSSRVAADAEEIALAAGADSYLEKTADLSSLLAHFREVGGAARRRRQVPGNA